MSITFEPLGLPGYVKIASGAELAVLPCNHERTLAGLSDPGINTQLLMNLILEDPVLTASVLREASRQIKDRPHMTLTSMTHALSVLGFERTSVAVKLIKSVAKEPTRVDEARYRDSLASSLFATAMTIDWQKVLHQVNYDQMLIAAMLMRMPEWCLWQLAPKEMSMIERLTQEHGMSRQSAERNVLGCTIDEIALEMTRTWQLSDIVQSAMDRSSIPKPQLMLRWAKRTLASLNSIQYRDESVRRPEISTALRAMLTNWVAIEARQDWYGRGMKRCLRLVAAYLNMSEDEAWQRVRDTAIKLARTVPDPATAQLAASLLWPPRPPMRGRISQKNLKSALEVMYAGTDIRSRTLAWAPPATAAIPQSELNPLANVSRDDWKPMPRRQGPISDAVTQKWMGIVSTANHRRFQGHLGRLLGNTTPFRSEHELLRTSADVLVGCTALERVVVCLVRNGQSTVSSYYAAGCDRSPGLRRLESPLQPVNLFTQIIRQPVSVWMSAEKQTTEADRLPANFRQVSQIGSFFLASMFTHEGAFAVLYADKGYSYNALTDADYTVFRLLVNTANRGLANLGR